MVTASAFSREMAAAIEGQAEGTRAVGTSSQVRHSRAQPIVPMQSQVMHKFASAGVEKDRQMQGRLQPFCANSY